MATIKYHASGHFDIETEVEIPDDEAVDDLAIWLAIVGDLENRYGLAIDFRRDSDDQVRN